MIDFCEKIVPLLKYRNLDKIKLNIGRKSFEIPWISIPYNKFIPISVAILYFFSHYKCIFNRYEYSYDKTKRMVITTPNY